MKRYLFTRGCVTNAKLQHLKEFLKSRPTATVIEITRRVTYQALARLCAYVIKGPFTNSQNSSS